MSFFTFFGASRPQTQADLPDEWDEPYYEDDELVVLVHTGCPFPVDSLAEYDPTFRPPPFFPGQEMEARDFNRSGSLRGTRYLRAVEVGGPLRWVQTDYRGEPADRWAGVVLFPA